MYFFDVWQSVTIHCNSMEEIFLKNYYFCVPLKSYGVERNCGETILTILYFGWTFPLSAHNDNLGTLSLIVLVSIFASDKSWFLFLFPFISAYSTFYIVGLVLSMQIPFVGFQPIRTSEHMAAAGKTGLPLVFFNCCSFTLISDHLAQLKSINSSHESDDLHVIRLAPGIHDRWESVWQSWVCGLMVHVCVCRCICTASGLRLSAVSEG